MTTNLTFTQTFLQKLLGRNYKWWYIATFFMRSAGSSLSGFIIQQSSDIIQILLIVYIWLLNGSNSQIITYLVIGRIYKALADTYFSETLGPEIISGEITKHLILPQSYFKLSFFREIGKRLSFNLPRAAIYLIVIAIYFKNIDWNHFTFISLGGLLIILPVTFVSTFFMEILVGSQAFFVNDKRTFQGLWKAYIGITGALSGVLIPLDKLPLYNEIIQFLPTSWLLHHPMQIYLGKYSPLETLYVFLGGITWCVVLYFLAKWVFKLGLKKNESVGL